MLVCVWVEIVVVMDGEGRFGSVAPMGLLVERSGLDEADFCRRAILGQRVPVRRAKASDALLYELYRIGNNLNQIAKAAHLGKPLAGKLDETLSDLRAIMRRADDGGADGP